MKQVKIDFLDDTLNYLKNMSIFNDGENIINKEDIFTNKLRTRALKKLIKDGYAYEETTINEKNNCKSIRYFISYEGLLALENTPFFLKNCPYKYNSLKNRLVFYWSVTKITAVLINAMVILYFTYKTYYK